MKIYVNGTLQESSAPHIDVNDRGFSLGDGLFETIKYDGERLQFFEQHFQRFKLSAKTLFIPFEYSANDLQRVCLDLINQNKLEKQTVAIRLTLTRGVSKRGIAIHEQVSPTLVITSVPYQPPTTYPKTYITTIRRNEYSPITQLKTTHYLESILARQSAVSSGYDEGIMLNTRGYITETSIANLFLVANNTVRTAPIHSGIMPGIIRGIIIQCCKLAEIDLVEEEIDRRSLDHVCEAFQTNSLIGIQPLSSINDIQLSLPPGNTVTSKITSLYKKHFESPNA